MALTGISTAETFDYVSPKDPAKGTPDETRFHLGYLDVFLMAHVYDRATTFDENGKVELNTNGTNVDAVRFGLKGWTNFKDEVGNDIPFETEKKIVNGREYQVASAKTMERLPFFLIQEIAGRLKEGNIVSKREAKN